MRIPIAAWRLMIEECRRHQRWLDERKHISQRPSPLVVTEVTDYAPDAWPEIDELLTSCSGKPTAPPERGTKCTILIAYGDRGAACLFGWKGGADVSLWMD